MLWGKRLMLALGALAAVALSEESSLRGSRELWEGNQTFNMPQVNGLPVDYCLSYDVSYDSNGVETRHANNCGAPAADEFCRRQGDFSQADDFTAIYYAHDATYVLGSNSEFPRDENVGHGTHTYFFYITCRK